MNINKRLLQYVRTMRVYVVVIAFLCLLTALCIVFQNGFIAQIINGIFLQHKGWSLLWPAFSFLALFLVIRALLICGNELATNLVSTRVKMDLRSRLFRHLFFLGPLYTRGERSGEIVNTTSDGVESLDAYFIQYFPQVCATMIIPLVILVVVFGTDFLSGIVLLVTLPILPVFMILIGKRANAMTEKRWALLSTLSAHFLDVLQGMTTLKLFGRTKIQENTIRTISDRYGDTTMKVLKIAFLSSLVMEMGATISNAIIAVEVGLRLLYGTMPFEQAFFVLLLTPEFYFPLRSLGSQFHASIESAASANRIFDVLETPAPALSTGRQPASTSLTTVRHALCFKDVHYTYPSSTEGETRQEVLKGISFEIKAGQQVALVGPSGAGKSTIAQLLLRFMEPTGGAILADDLPIQQVPVQDWRKMVTWQPQRPYIFNTTIAENIRLGCADASDECVIEAARQAHLHDFILTLPQGYQTVVGERGARLSGGQIQRVSLARAFLKNAPILLLDEATSTLDAESEQQVLQALHQIMKDRIVLVIAHRLNTISSSDRILVLQDGAIVDYGTHTDLLSHSGLYQQLVRAYEDGEMAV